MTKKTIVDVVDEHIRASKAGYDGSRYMTMMNKRAKLTDNEVIAKANETNNLRATSNNFAIGGALTGGIAIDELFGRDERKQEVGVSRE